jgi:uncharacterized repeat protein (TIGR01451 family)
MKLTIKLFCIGMLLLASIQQAFADYVGELETTKYFDQSSIALLQTKITAGQPLTPADEISYFIQFTPTDNGGMVGGGGFVTDYIPAGMVVTGAQFVRLNGSGGYTQIAPPSPAAVLPAYVPVYSETGIFYSTDPRTAVYTLPASPTITAANGKALFAGTGCKGISLPSTTHNNWDSAMQTKYVKAVRVTAGTCVTPPVVNYSLMGASPVAGPDTLIQLDATVVVGPWQRIAYPGSMKGTMTGVAAYGTTNSCIGGTPTSAGYNLSSANPLPVNTNAVRFAAGKVTVGELFTVRITMRPSTNLAPGNIINNSEVFGGDASLDPGSTAGKDNHWKYHCPAVAISNGNLVLVKTLVGVCVGAGCVPSAVTAGVVPSAANLKLRYKIKYYNLGTVPQTNVVLKDTFATGATYVAASYTPLVGTTPTAPAFAAGVLTFPAIPSLAAAASGELQYDVNFVTAPASTTALINTANMTSTQIPAPGVSSKSIATATSLGNLWLTKSTTTSTTPPGGAVNYSINIANNGGAAVTAILTKPITISDFLPTAGISTLSADRFSYLGPVTAQIISATGVITAATPTVVVTAPATPTAREKVVFTFTAGSIPSGSRLVLNYSATAGANVPASATPYLSDANVWYSGGPGGGAANSSYSEDIGTAPVTVTAPMTLTLKVDCVYAGATCIPYANGTIAPNSKIRYRADYKNIGATTLNTVVLTDTLPANISYVAGTAQRDGSPIANPSFAGPVMTFAGTTLLANQAGYMTFDALLGAGVTSGTDITNTAKITASTFTAGVTASVTTSVRDRANLQITKTVSPSTIQAGGVVTYAVTVTNTGNAAANSIVLYDLLPFTGTVADPTVRFNYTAAGAFTLTNTSATSTVAGVAPTNSAPPTFTGYTAQTNRQEIKWSFPAAQLLGKGDSFTLTYTATVGANVPASATAYTSDVQAQYISATVPPSSTMYVSATNVAPVTVGGGLDHIRILHNGSGLTCQPETLTVKACGDAACTDASLYKTGSVTTTLNGVNPAISFSGGSTTASLAVTTAGAFALGATNTSPTPGNGVPVRCFNGATETCTLNFADAGFILASVSGGSEATVLTQVAGVVSTTYVLRAVKADKTTGACTAGVTGNQTVNFGYECNDPTSCAAGNLLKVNGTAVQSNNNNPLFGYSYSGINLTFDANGNATTPISISYEDVGQITLRVQKTVNGKDMLGNSNAFIVRPHHFAVDACNSATAGDCAAGSVDATSGSALLAVAGTDAATQATSAFKATVRALSANNNDTPSFATAGSANGGTSHTSQQVTLAATCSGTCTGVTGGLLGTVAITRNSFSNGVATVSDLTWSEVGIIDLTASNAAFMTGTSGTQATKVVGRFVPAWFETVATGQMVCPTGLVCPTGGMVYSGQVFASAKVTAMNAVGAQTNNYTGAFAHAVTLSAVNAVAGNTAVVGGAPGGSLAIAATDFSSGSVTLSGAFATNSGAPLFTFTVNPTAPTDVYLRAVETSGTDGVASGPAGKTTQGGLKVVSGRIKLSHAYGSELLPLTLNASAQYYGATGWTNSLTDNATVIGLATSYPVGTAGGSTSPTPQNGTVSSGKLSIKLSKPGVKGVATITSTAHAYMGLLAGQVTFGVYKGANEFIYLRESY